MTGVGHEPVAEALAALGSLDLAALLQPVLDRLRSAPVPDLLHTRVSAEHALSHKYKREQKPDMRQHPHRERCQMAAPETQPAKQATPQLNPATPLPLRVTKPSATTSAALKPIATQAESTAPPSASPCAHTQRVLSRAQAGTRLAALSSSLVSQRVLCWPGCG